MPTGTVTALFPEKAFGFIRPDDSPGADVFFHQSVYGEDFASLQSGVCVRYELDDTAEKPRAKSVVVIPSGKRAPEERVNRHPKARRKKPSWRQ